MCAAANRHQGAVEFLLENGADPTVVNNEHQNALHLAAMNGSSDVMIALLEAGVDANAVTDIGVSHIFIGMLFTMPQRNHYHQFLIHL